VDCCTTGFSLQFFPSYRPLKDELYQLHTYNDNVKKLNFDNEFFLRNTIQVLYVTFRFCNKYKSVFQIEQQHFLFYLNEMSCLQLLLYLLMVKVDCLPSIIYVNDKTINDKRFIVSQCTQYKLTV